MSKLTYIQIVQRVASAIDTDNVTSISDSPESEQISLLVQTMYDELLSEFPWYHKRETVNLEATPTDNILALPSDVEQMLSKIIYYNSKPVYYWRADQMQDYLARQDRTADNIDANGAQTDKDPTYWTSYDDENIIFDSYDGSLAPSLSEVWVAKHPTPPMADDDVPDMPHILHSVLLNGVLAEAFRTLKGDEIAARAYEGKYTKGKAKAKRWARRLNIKEDAGVNNDFGRKNGNRTRTEIPTSFIVEG